VDVRRAKRNASLAAGASVVALALVGFAAFEFTGQVSQASQATPAGQATRGAQPNPAASGAGQSGAPATTKTTPAPTVTATPSSAQSTRQARVLGVTVEAFGPHGTSDGDNPQWAASVTTGQAPQWSTQWYATPLFGQLKGGTGLLLDLGGAATVSKVTVQLGGGESGADLELRGSTARQQPGQPGAFQTLATLSDAGGTATFTLTTPARARYLLLWCTKLPPNPASSGTYALVVRQATVDGQP
jgi:putative peptidoglycan lipid II flippase